MGPWDGKVGGRLAGRGIAEAGQGVLQRLHLGESEQEGEGGFGTLILAQAVHVEAVATAAGGGIVDGQTEVVPAEIYKHDVLCNFFLIIEQICG